MTATVVRYQAKPDRADENQQLIEAVFADLDQRRPDGFTYKVFRLEDGVSFVHVVIEHDDVADPDSLQDVPAFQAFVQDIGDRCDVPPLAMGATVVGRYLGDDATREHGLQEVEHDSRRAGSAPRARSASRHPRLR